MDTYQSYISALGRLLRDGEKLPLGGYDPLPIPELPADAPKALLFSPHPDDECIIGGLPLRLMREQQCRIINVAVTLGSNKARQAERWKELQAACRFIGFELVATRENGLEKINLKTREQDPEHWADATDCVREVLESHCPRFIFFPHATDRNGTHMGTHKLLLDALRKLRGKHRLIAVETEFWEPMPHPNMLIESSESDVTDLITALSFHVGEVRRNPYHLRMPAWMIDNIRRGAERVGGQGGRMPSYLYGTLYRARLFQNGRFRQLLDQGCLVSQTDDLGWIKDA